MTTPNKAKDAKYMMSRRGILLSGVTLAVASAIPSFCPSPAIAAVDPAVQDRFMRLSSLLVNHQLNPAVGARIAATATSQHANLAQMLDSIIAIANGKNATEVEQFFKDIPDGELKDFAHWVIFAWYSGCSSEKRDATVFTYEEALTFKTTSDILNIPSYGFSGPNRWQRPTAAVADVPRF